MVLITCSIEDVIHSFFLLPSFPMEDASRINLKWMDKNASHSLLNGFLSLFYFSSSTHTHTHIPSVYRKTINTVY